MDIKKVKFDDFVNKVNDPSQKPTHKFTVSGYVGKSPTANHIRIYADHSLNHYVELSAADVIHQESLPSHNHLGGGSVLWIKAGAHISHGSDSYHYDPKNNYFKGDIADAFGGPPTTIPSVNCDGGAPTKSVVSMCCPGPPTRTIPSMCCDGGAPTKSVVSMCCPGPPTRTIPSMCCDGGAPTKSIVSMCCPGPPTTNMRTFCCDGGAPTKTIVSMCCPGPPTTNMRTFCCDGGAPTKTIVSMCCPGPPTTNMRSFCCDGGLPTSGMRSYCCDMNDVGAHIPTYSECNVTFNCGTGGYNPYDGF